jgi:hypothetical protein
VAVYWAVQEGDNGLTFVMYSEAADVLFVCITPSNKAVQKARKK